MSAPNELVQALAQRETLAEDILTDKELIIDSDRKRNSNREALTSMRKKLANEQKLWVNMGDMFIKLPKKDIQVMIEDDQKKLDEEIEKRRDTMKKKAMKLDQLEQLQPNGKPLAGYDLQGMKASDLYHLRNRKIEERDL
ncbi:hypothetical protein K450DRAFT_217492, partial [Umbelopsis ramanniana AG]